MGSITADKLVHNTLATSNILIVRTNKYPNGYHILIQMIFPLRIFSKNKILISNIGAVEIEIEYCYQVFEFLYNIKINHYCWNSNFK